MSHGDSREGKWRGNWRMEWVASTLHTTSEHGVSSITTADAHTSSASSRLNWRPRQFKWTRPFSRKTKSGFCACAITFHTQSTVYLNVHLWCIASHVASGNCSLHPCVSGHFSKSEWNYSSLCIKVISSPLLHPQSYVMFKTKNIFLKLASLVNHLRYTVRAAVMPSDTLWKLQ
jgi:hypothetical protein